MIGKPAFEIKVGDVFRAGDSFIEVDYLVSKDVSQVKILSKRGGVQDVRNQYLRDNYTLYRKAE